MHSHEQPNSKYNSIAIFLVWIHKQGYEAILYFFKQKQTQDRECDISFMPNGMHFKSDLTLALSFL